MTWLASLWLCPMSSRSDIALIYASKPMPGKVGIISLIKGPEHRIFPPMQSIFRSLLSVCSVRGVVFAGGSMPVVVLCMSCFQASHHPASRHARPPTRHQAPSVQSARHGLPATARVSTACRLCASYRRGRELSPPPWSPSLPGPGPGPPIDLGELKRGCDHGMRRTLWVSLGR